MKVRSLALALLFCAGPALGLALNACSSSTDATGADASVDHTTQPAEVDDANRIPCAPRLVLQTVCQQCHTRPTKNQAPFPIQRLSDVLTVYQGQTIRDDMIVELEAGRMPLAPVTISAQDKATLLAWLKSGAPAVAATSCTETDGGDEAGPALDAGDGGEDASDAASDADAM